MNYIDLFSGCGGFRKGFEESGFSFKWEGHSEIDKYASSVYERHYPNSEVLGNVNDVRTDELPGGRYIISFGFPCQDLSIAGKRKGLSGQRSGLFYRAMQIVREVKPDYFIFENVKGLFSSNDGRDFVEVLREVADSGYDGQWQMLNTAWFLPQNRERIYFVGNPRGKGRRKIFPFEESYGISVKEPQKKQKLSTLDIKCGGLTHTSNYFAIPVLTPDRPEKRQNGRIFKEDGDPMFTITAQDRHGIFDGNYIRKLTPKECERAQGLPDDWTRLGKNGDEISDSQRYKMIGNAVSVPVVKAVAERLA